MLNLACSALLVIDMQRDFLDPRGYAAQAGLDIQRLREIIPNVQALLAAARKSHLRVIFTREGHRSDLSDCPATKLARSVAAGAKIGHAGPLGRLLVRGVTTEVCVHTTVRAATDCGYHCITVADACAASEAHLQQPALDMLQVEGGIFGGVAHCAEALQQIESSPKAIA